MPIEFIIATTFFISIIALVVGCGALWHSRTNRRALRKLIEGNTGQAWIILAEAASD
jgi:hypothetical protein